MFVFVAFVATNASAQFESPRLSNSFNSLYLQWNPSTFKPSEGDNISFTGFTLGYNHDFRLISNVPLFLDYMWEVISGSFVIKSITDIEMTIQFNEMVIKHKNSGVERTIEGTAVLNSGTYKDGKLLPFSESINSLPDWLEGVY